jgi:hypothetical protein
MARVENEIKPSSALHVTNSNQTSGFWSKVLVNLDSGISNGYIEFDIRTENIGSGAWLDLMLEADNGRYKQLTIQQINGKYYFEEQANTNQFKEAELGKWHHVKFVIKNNSATVEVDGVSITNLNGGLNAPVTILNFQLSKPGNYDFYIDNVKQLIRTERLYLNKTLTTITSATNRRALILPFAADTTLIAQRLTLLTQFRFSTSRKHFTLWVKAVRATRR